EGTAGQYHCKNGLQIVTKSSLETDITIHSNSSSIKQSCLSLIKVVIGFYSNMVGFAAQNYFVLLRKRELM
ncbi:MAG: hypothetical protein IKI93_12505, partial [Clostridia bacterium]|nr:hypothetical protein [Clostridia bacterium]